MTIAITPKGAKALARKEIPEKIIKVFNELIVANLKSGSATIGQEEVIKRLVRTGYKREELFDNEWLDIEDLYQDAGWSVDYDKPAYNETYEATFIFKAKRVRV